MAKTAIAIRHIAFEDLGAFDPVLRRAGYSVNYHDAGVDDFSSLDALEPELLFVLGGPIGAYEDGAYPFLLHEIDILKQRLAAARPTFGICLGAQLMARALGSRVYPATQKEIGFAPIYLTTGGERSCLSVFAGAHVLHWHGDTFDLPHGATRLASTNVCENQAFAFGQNALGVQFHPEAGASGFERWLLGHAFELAHAQKDVNQLRSEGNLYGHDLQASATACLTCWLEQLER